MQWWWRQTARISALALAVTFTGSLVPAPAGAATVQANAQGQPQTGLKVVPLKLTTRNGRTHLYKVEVAATPGQQAHGMMFRNRMAPGTGMIFPLNPPRAASFWMRNTLIPLDLIFIGSDGKVRNIAANAVPKSEAMLSSVGPVAAVLELKGGEAERIGLAPGDRVQW